MGGRIVFSSPNGFYTYDDITRQIIPFQKLNAILPYIRNAHSVVSDVYKRQVVEHSVHYIERRSVTEGTHTTDGHFRTFARRSRIDRCV